MVASRLRCRPVRASFPSSPEICVWTSARFLFMDGDPLPAIPTAALTTPNCGGLGKAVGCWRQE
ncbi:hypothetical protein E2C01_046696 [Portunus trituberculatus]|uniref:Uncharacterized protein n=1 Tax=Portunus trituberculatus TaxID=210409 RepID=A0A5B7G6V2_PORTR|nr:hypothetical protein [Portunus trituberculatus]